MSHPRRAVLALVIALLLVSTASLSASDQELVHRNWSRSMSVGASVVGGTPTGDPVQLVSGIAGSEYTSTRGGAIEATDDAIVLRRDGTYQIQLEGTVFFSSADATVDPDASGLFTIWIGGPFAVCSFSSAQDAPILRR